MLLLVPFVVSKLPAKRIVPGFHSLLTEVFVAEQLVRVHEGISNTEDNMATSFSYAQAAKGETMSRSGSQEGSTSQNTEVHQNQTATVQQEKKKTLGLALDMSKNKGQPRVECSPVQDVSVNNNPADQLNGSTGSISSKVEHSGTVSPSVSSNEISKSLGEDADSSTPAASEPRWEKTSQDSQSERAAEKAEEDLAGTKLPSIERARPQMKEAPVPVFNVWQKRMEDAQAKIIPRPASSAVVSERSTSWSHGDNEGQRIPSKSVVPVRRAGSADLAAQQRMTKPIQNGSPTANIPPSSSDVSLWPTPDLAKVEEKKKEVDPSDNDKPTAKTHGKEKWEKIAFVPTAVFNTPLPIRGGARGGRTGIRGGRESISRGGSTSAALGATTDRANLTNGNESQGPVLQTADRPRFRETNFTRNGAAYKPKRSSSAGPSSFQENGQTNDNSLEKRDGMGHRAFPNQRSMDHRRTSTSTQADSAVFNGQEKRSFNSTDGNGESRFNRSERPYQSRASIAGMENNAYFPPRDRGEGRPERGSRGNWRSGKPGPASHASFGSNSHYQQNHGYTNGKPYNEQRHNSHPTAFGPGRESRHNRGNSRSQSIPNNQAPGRFAMQNGGPNGLPALQTDMVNAYPYAQPTTIMSAVPFQSYMEHVQLPAMLQMQLEYYLSVDNLCKDIFLRKNMDGQGFVFLHILQNFNRIQILTTDTNLIKWVCGRSSLIELVTGADGFDRVRKAEDWQQWVLPMEDRDPSAQNDGPAQLLSPRFEGFVNGLDMSPLGFPQSHPMSPTNPNMMNGYRGEPMFESFNQRGQFESGSTIQTPLTADVPDFKPTQASQELYTQFQNGMEVEEKFPDANLESLQISIKTLKGERDSVSPISHNLSTSSKPSDDSNKENEALQASADVVEEQQANGVAKSTAR